MLVDMTGRKDALDRKDSDAKHPAKRLGLPARRQNRGHSKQVRAAVKKLNTPAVFAFLEEVCRAEMIEICPFTPAFKSMSPVAFQKSLGI
jgi:hypothetical protein